MDGMAMLEGRKLLALLLLAIFAIQYSDGHGKPLISIGNDGIRDASGDYFKVKFPTVKILKFFNWFDNNGDRKHEVLRDLIERKLEKFEEEKEMQDALFELKLEKWEDRKERFGEKFLDLFDLFKDKQNKKLETKTKLMEKKIILPVYEPACYQHYYPRAQAPYYAPSPPKYKTHKPYSRPSSLTYDAESASSEEESYAYKRERPVKPKRTVYSADNDDEAHYFT